MSIYAPPESTSLSLSPLYESPSLSLHIIYVYVYYTIHTHTHMRESLNVSREHIPIFDEHLSWRIRSDGRGACPPDVFAHSAALSACEAAGKRGQDDPTPLDFCIERLFHVKCC